MIYNNKNMKSTSSSKGFHGTNGSGKAKSASLLADPSKGMQTKTGNHNSFGFSGHAKKISDKADVSKPGNTPTAFHG